MHLYYIYIYIYIFCSRFKFQSFQFYLFPAVFVDVFCLVFSILVFFYWIYSCLLLLVLFSFFAKLLQYSTIVLYFSYFCFRFSTRLFHCFFHILSSYPQQDKQYFGRSVMSAACDCCACAQMWESDNFKAYFWDLSGQIVYRAMHSFSFGRFLQHKTQFIFLQISIILRSVSCHRVHCVCLLQEYCTVCVYCRNMPFQIPLFMYICQVHSLCLFCKVNGP